MNNRELYHHGIKGQKWGVRRFQNKDGSLTKAGKERKSISTNHNKTKKVSKQKTKLSISKRAIKDWINNNNNNLLNMQIQQANQFAMEQATRASINASLQAASLSMSGGTNPFMFGMM